MHGRKKLLVEVGDKFLHLNTKGARSARDASLLSFDWSFPMDLHPEYAFLESPVGMNPQETLAENDKARNVLNRVWRKIMQLDPVHINKCTEKGMQRERQTSGEMVREDDAFIFSRMGDFFILLWPAPAARSLRNLALLLQLLESLRGDARGLPFALLSRGRRAHGGSFLARGSRTLLAH